MRPSPVLAASLLLTSALVVGCGDQVTASPDPGERRVDWQELADPPLSPRLGQITVWTGTEVLVVGGDTGDPCPAGADCGRATEAAKDGAAYDPERDAWRPIADAPVDLPAYTDGEMVAGHLFVLQAGALLDYAVKADRWTVVREKIDPWYYVVGDGDRLLLVSGSDEEGVRPDLAYDVAHDTWSRLPEDPLGPSFSRGMISTPHGVVLEGQKLVASPGSDGPSLIRAAVLDRKSDRWTLLPDTGQTGGGVAGWTGRRIVDLALGGSDGGEVGNYGRTYPAGGTLDPVTGTWEPLKRAPKEFSGGWPVEAAGPELIAGAGWIYGDNGATWTKVTRPNGAPDHPGRAVWIDDGLTLVVIGGFSQDERKAEDAYVVGAWSWRPATGPFQ